MKIKDKSLDKVCLKSMAKQAIDIRNMEWDKERKLDAYSYLFGTLTLFLENRGYIQELKK